MARMAITAMAHMAITAMDSRSTMPIPKRNIRSFDAVRDGKGLREMWTDQEVQLVLV